MLSSAWRRSSCIVWLAGSVTPFSSVFALVEWWDWMPRIGSRQFSSA
jgi:hypothetical protein